MLANACPVFLSHAGDGTDPDLIAGNKQRTDNESPLEASVMLVGM